MLSIVLSFLTRAGQRRNQVCWAALLAAAVAHGSDWPQYRGATHNGISTDRIKWQWPVGGPAPAWRVPCTNGPSSLAITGSRIFTQIRRNINGSNKEVCLALDAETGAELWASVVGEAVYDGGVGLDDGPRSTPSVDDGRVIVLSSHLVLHCFGADDGRTQWTKDLRTLYGGVVLGWQNSASPLVDNGLVFVNCNSPAQSLLALRTADGGLQWRAEVAGLTHSTPVTATIGGVPQVIFAARHGLVAVDRRNGTLLWRGLYPFSYDTSLATSPVVFEDLVFISGNYSMGSYAVRVASSGSTFTVTPAWTNAAQKSHWMTPVCHQGYLYGMFGSVYTAPLRCIDIRTGVQKWSINGFGRGGTILVDNQLVVLTERGDLVVVDPTPIAYTEKARFTLFPGYDPDTNKCWNVPAVCDGRIYARSTAELVCLDLAVPSLKLTLTPAGPGSGLQLCIDTDSGVPIEPERLAAIEVLWTTNVSLNFDSWQRFSNTLVLTNGQVRAAMPETSGTAYYVAKEIP